LSPRLEQFPVMVLSPSADFSAFHAMRPRYFVRQKLTLIQPSLTGRLAQATIGSMSPVRSHSARAYVGFVCLRGNDRIRFPVAANTALSTAGAATLMVGSPTPPQKSPDGMTMASTLERFSWMYGSAQEDGTSSDRSYPPMRFICFGDPDRPNAFKGAVVSRLSEKGLDNSLIANCLKLGRLH